MSQGQADVLLLYLLLEVRRQGGVNNYPLWYIIGFLCSWLHTRVMSFQSCLKMAFKWHIIDDWVRRENLNPIFLKDDWSSNLGWPQWLQISGHIGNLASLQKDTDGLNIEHRAKFRVVMKQGLELIKSKLYHVTTDKTH